VGRKVLLVNPKAGSLDGDAVELLRRELPEFELVDEPPVGPLEVLAVAGGDGTVGAVGRRLAGSEVVLGIIPAGTFNNFAAALGIPADLMAAARLVRSGTPREVTVGQVNGVPFLEAAAIGLLGDAIALGEAAKELRFGELPERLRAVAGDRQFSYRVFGDVQLEAEALSIVVANTPSTGARLPIGSSTPREPDLELSAGSERHRVRSVRIETDPPVRVYADAAEVGETPAVIQTVPGGLKVLL